MSDGTSSSTGTVIVTGPAGTKVAVSADNLVELEGGVAATVRALRRHDGPMPFDPEFPPRPDDREATDGR